MSSGDLLADRRFAFAETMAAAGDHAAAAELFEQALERAPDWAAAWLALGLARERIGDAGGARGALDRAASLDADGVLGAILHRARLHGARVEAMPPSFVRALFDGYADRFDVHLASLAYTGPALIAAALGRAGGTTFETALDLGCGTGLMARQLADRSGAIDGVDLSARMVEKATRTGLYRTLAVGDIEVVLGAMPAGGYDLVLAADVFVYLGPLGPVLRETRRVLRPKGWLAFTVQCGDAPFALGDDMRFSHGRDYVESVLAEAGFEVAVLDAASTRRDRGVAVPGLVVVARGA